MAGNPVTGDTQADADYLQHEETYELFLGLMKWVIVACVVILVGMAVFLV